MIRRIAAMVLALLLLLGGAMAEYKELMVGSKDTSTDWAIYSLQMKLIELGYLEGIADGMFGNGTAAAVSAFQADYGLPVSGIADVETQELLFTLEAEADPNATPSPDDEALGMGDVNNDVFIMQNNLYIWGFITAEPDGIFGTGTRQALAEFQEYAYEDILKIHIVRKTRTPYGSIPDGASITTEEPLEISKYKYTKCLDYDKMKGSFQVRTRRSGDYLIIDDSQHRKRLKEYFINEKISGKVRNQILLLAEEAKVLWVIGGRISADMKISEQTTKALKVQITGGNYYEN